MTQYEENNDKARDCQRVDQDNTVALEDSPNGEPAFNTVDEGQRADSYGADANTTAPAERYDADANTAPVTQLAAALQQHTHMNQPIETGQPSVVAQSSNAMQGQYVAQGQYAAQGQYVEQAQYVDQSQYVDQGQYPEQQPSHTTQPSYATQHSQVGQDPFVTPNPYATPHAYPSQAPFAAPVANLQQPNNAQQNKHTVQRVLRKIASVTAPFERNVVFRLGRYTLSTFSIIAILVTLVGFVSMLLPFVSVGGFRTISLIDNETGWLLVVSHIVLLLYIVMRQYAVDAMIAAVVLFYELWNVVQSSRKIAIINNLNPFVYSNQRISISLGVGAYLSVAATIVLLIMLIAGAILQSQRSEFVSCDYFGSTKWHREHATKPQAAQPGMQQFVSMPAGQPDGQCNGQFNGQTAPQSGYQWDNQCGGQFGGHIVGQSTGHDAGYANGQQSQQNNSQAFGQQTYAQQAYANQPYHQTTNDQQTYGQQAYDQQPVASQVAPQQYESGNFNSADNQDNQSVDQ